MSGGELNYLGCSSHTIYVEHLDRAAEMLRADGFVDAALATERVADALRFINAEKSALREVWLKLDLIASGDSAAGSEREAVEEWRKLWRK